MGLQHTQRNPAPLTLGSIFYEAGSKSEGREGADGMEDGECLADGRNVGDQE